MIIKKYNQGTREEIKIETLSYEDGTYGYRAIFHYADGCGTDETDWVNSEEEAIELAEKKRIEDWD